MIAERLLKSGDEGDGVDSISDIKENILWLLGDHHQEYIDLLDLLPHLRGKNIVIDSEFKKILNKGFENKASQLKSTHSTGIVEMKQAALEARKNIQGLRYDTVCDVCRIKIKKDDDEILAFPCGHFFRAFCHSE